MKSFLQKYESQTRYFLIGSLVLLVAGVSLYFAGFGFGAFLGLVGLIGLGWCFLRR